MLTAQRIMKGQRAAVCGLVIAGVSMPTACAIAGVSPPRMSRMLPYRWARYRTPPKFWTDERLDEARELWFGAKTTAEIADRMGVTTNALWTVASKNGWGKRGRLRLRPVLHTLPPTQRYLYQKLRASLPHEEALAGALAGWRDHEGAHS